MAVENLLFNMHIYSTIINISQLYIRVASSRIMVLISVIDQDVRL